MLETTRGGSHGDQGAHRNVRVTCRRPSLAAAAPAERGALVAGTALGPPADRRL